MKVQIKMATFLLGFCISTFALAQDISGVWQQIDDQSGEAKAQIALKKDNRGGYTGTIIKITPRPGYTPKELCVNCPAPYTNKPVLGLNIITGLKHVKDKDYDQGKILDPLTGKVYSLKAKLNQNGKILRLRGYLGTAVLGRSQTWLRVE
ncbi:DUF2147 domain-containing protein [Acinetobacter sp. Marseille-Q1618]|uniref:DUF2147 domain-containing protein n=1 Tax=Acinetobacter sp. Marseille-Q1618 TaxID=2697502 RepID=UPI00156D9E46|nr:DUF2147 domain-containing protein [Acinetobacter sp. Marseille-Q1618]